MLEFLYGDLHLLKNWVLQVRVAVDKVLNFAWWFIDMFSSLKKLGLQIKLYKVSVFCY